MLIKDFDCRYHRNGVSGIRFFACKFKWKDDLGTWKDMLATVWTEDGGKMENEFSDYYAILDPSDLSARYRGDRFIDDLLPLIREHAANMRAHAYEPLPAVA